MFCQALLDEFVDICRKIMEGNLTGVYLHGSLAMGCFHPEKSDVDLLVVTNGDLSDEQKLQLMRDIVCLNEKALKKGLEFSIIKEQYCNPFVYPTPFELHFSPVHLNWFRNDPKGYIENMKGTDKDLAAHVMITNKYGISLFGKPVKEVFGEVLRQDYIDSIYGDIENAKEDILEDGIYMTLNLCRVLAYLKDNLCLSKEKGGQWGLENLSNEYHPIIREALHCYQTECEFHTDADLLKNYAQYLLKQIHSFH